MRSDTSAGSHELVGRHRDNVTRVSDTPPGPPPPPSSSPPPPPPPNLAPPPGYVAYGNAPVPTERVRRIKGLSTAILVLVGIAGAASLIGAVLAPGAADSAQDFLNGQIDEDEFAESIAGLTFAQIIGGLTTLAAMVVVMIWMYRIAANLRAHGMKTTWHPLWAVFGWMVPPFALYVVPMLMLRELWSQSAHDPVAPPGGQRSGENVALWIWFLLFGIVPAILFVVQFSTFSGFAGTDMESVAENIDDAGGLSLLSGLATAGAAAAWVVFARQLTDRHRRLTNEH